MAMTVGSAGGSGKVPQPVMNVTPLVDVVLVLLIIFMVIAPLMSKNFWVHTPKQEKEDVDQAQIEDDPTPPLVLHVAGTDTIQVNGQAIGFAELPDRLKRMFAAREDHIVFFDAAEDAEYGFAVRVMDQARAGGAVTIAALTKPLETPGDADSAAPAPGGDGAVTAVN